LKSLWLKRCRVMANLGRYETGRCEGCGERTRASGCFCRSCQSKRHHARKDVEAGKYLIDLAGGSWWVWTDKGEVVVIGKSTKQQAFNCLAHGDPDMGEN